MQTRIETLQGRRALVSVATCQKTLEDRRSRQLDVLAMADGRAVIVVGNDSLALSGAESDSLGGYEDQDVLLINELGMVRRLYSVGSSENTLFITGRCNSSCLMCPDTDGARARAHDSDIDGLIALVRHIPSDAPHLTLTGGEPFMVGERIFELFEELGSSHPQTFLQLLTNGRIMAVEAYRERFAKTFPKYSIIGIPLHGPDAGCHDRITQVEGSFVQTCTGISALLGMGYTIETRFVVSALSADFATETARLIASKFKDVATVKFMGLEMLGSAARRKADVWIPYRSAFTKIREAIYVLLDAGIDVGIYNFPLCSVDRCYWHLCKKSISSYKVRYPSGCVGCSVMDACGGIFAGSQWVASDDVRPIA